MSEQPRYEDRLSNENNPAYPSNSHPTPMPTPPYNQYQPQPEQSKGMAITALILGILTVVFSLIPIIAVPLGVVAVILGVMSLRKNIGKGMSIAGITTGAVGVLISLAVFIFTFMALQALNDAGEITLEFSDEIERSIEEYNDDVEGSIDFEIERLDSQVQGT